MCFMKKRFVKNVSINNDAEYNSDEVGENYEIEEENDFFIGTLSKTTKTTAAEWNIEVLVEGNKMVCQVDTGSQVNIISTDILNKLYVKNLLKKTKVNIFTFSGEKLKVLGSVDLKIVYENQSHILNFFVVNMKCKNIIGLQSARDMFLIKNVNLLSVNNIIENYSEVFCGLGLLHSECNLEIRKDISPVVDPPRKIPFRLYDALKMELKRMVDLNVIRKINEPTEWVSSILEI